MHRSASSDDPIIQPHGDPPATEALTSWKAVSFPTLHQLQIFVAVARRRSFARAAEELFLSSPTVSLQVHRLEEHYGVRLLDRTSRGAVLTEPGAILFSAAEALLSGLQEATGAIERTKNTVRGSLDVGAQNLVATYRLPLAITTLQNQFPDVEVNLLIAQQDQLEQAVLTDRIELSIFGRQVRSRHLRSQPYGMAWLELLASPSNPLAAMRFVPRDALGDQTLLLREPGSRTRQTVEEAIEHYDLRFKDIVEVEGSQGLNKAVLMNRGVGFSLPTTSEIELRMGQIVVIRVQDISLGFPFYLVTRPDQELSKPAQALLVVFGEILRQPTLNLPEIVSR